MKNFLKHLSGHKSSRRSTGNRKRIANRTTEYQTLEPRKLLATLTVDTLSDVVDLNDGLVSLREAITAANTNAAFGDAPAGDGDATGDAIQFASSLSGQTITLGGSELTIEDDLVIRGNNNITISGDDASRILRITTAENVTLSRINFIDGEAANGGAFLSEGGGTVRLFESQFSSNEAVEDGGAVFNRDSRLLIFGSSFTDNIASGFVVASFPKVVRLVSLARSFLEIMRWKRRGDCNRWRPILLFRCDDRAELNRCFCWRWGRVVLGGVDASALFLKKTRAATVLGSSSPKKPSRDWREPRFV